MVEFSIMLDEDFQDNLFFRYAIKDSSYYTYVISLNIKRFPGVSGVKNPPSMQETQF